MSTRLQRETKFIKVPFEVKSVNEDGTFEGYASVFGNIDFDGDVVAKGAFKRTIEQRGTAWPILWQHDVKEPIGVNEVAFEDDHGLYVKGKLAIDTPEGHRAWALLKMGALKGLSIGYQIINKGYEGKVRVLKELKLLEYSIVTFPANELAEVTNVKGLKAADFITTFQNARAEDELYTLRWQMSDALGEACCEVMDDETMTADDKKANIRTIYGQYCDAMTEWYGLLVDMRAAEEAAEGESSVMGQLEGKAGSAISKANKKKILDALSLHKSAVSMHNRACKMHGKAIEMCKALVTAVDDSTTDSVKPKNSPVTPTKPPAEPPQSDPGQKAKDPLEDILLAVKSASFLKQ